jgi:hypothetical protein
MRFELQKRIQREMDTRLPRGAKGSPQNRCRQVFYFYRSQGRPFEVALANAVNSVRQREPNFEPVVR